jgi:hypothetical protein
MNAPFPLPAIPAASERQDDPKTNVHINSTVPCDLRGGECSWPACDPSCPGRPGNAAPERQETAAPARCQSEATLASAPLQSEATAPARKLWWTKVDWAAVDAGMRRAIAEMRLKPGIVLDFRTPDRSAFDAWR